MDCRLSVNSPVVLSLITVFLHKDCLPFHLLDQAGTSTFVEPEKLTDKAIDRIWNESEETDEGRSVERKPIFHTLPTQKEEAVERAELTPIIDQIIDSLSKRFFAHGVRIEMDVEDDLLVDNNAESIEQIIFQSFQVVGKGIIESDDRFIEVKNKEVWKTIILEVAASGEGFQQSFIKSQIALVMTIIKIQLKSV